MGSHSSIIAGSYHGEVMRGSPLKVDARARLHIEVKGIVQGVGFRPFVYRLARNCHLNGWVRNTSANVAIEVEGLEENLSQFLSLLKEKAPHAARVQDVTTRKLPVEDDVDFVIRKSQPEAGKYQPVSPDLANLPLDDIDILFIENVGNLICPGGFDLGEYLKVVILSTPEGDDKPHKYPLLFSQANALVVNKTDLLPHVGFDMEAFARVFQGLNQQAALFKVAGITGDGIEDWGKWVMANLQKLRTQNSTR